MDRNYLLRSGIRIARLARIAAKLIDLFIVLILATFFYPVGVMFAAIYMAISDYLHQGQSVGKRFIGLAVISLEDGGPCTLKQSIIRNLPFLIPLIFSIVPIWGWIFSLLLGPALMALELYLLFKLDSGHRLGDVMADTTVVAPTRDGLGVRKPHVGGWFESEKALPLQ